MDRRTFLQSVIVGTLAAPLIVNTEERRYQMVRAKFRVLRDGYLKRGLPADAYVMFAGDEAINCYARGIAREFGPPRVTDTTDHPSYFGYSRILYSPHLGPWDVSEFPA